jgi:hypothetical protein
MPIPKDVVPNLYDSAATGACNDWRAETGVPRLGPGKQSSKQTEPPPILARTRWEV